MQNICRLIVGLTLALYLISACVASSATTFHVKPGGNDLADGTTLATAWASIDNGDQKGLVAAGDTVLVEPGTYSATRPAWFGVDDNCIVQLNNRGGTEGNPISYVANGPGVVLNIPTVSSHNSGIGVGVPWLVIDGFEFNGGTMAIVLVGGETGMVIKNCTIQNTVLSPMGASFMPGSSIGIFNNGSDNVTFSNNVFNNLNTVGGGNITTAAWNYWGHNDTYINNVFSNIGSVSEPGAWGNEGAIVGLLLDMNIYNNTFVNVSSAMVAFGGSTQSSNVKFINNIVSEASQYAIRNDSTAPLANSYNLFWSNVANYAGNVSTGTGEFNADPKFVSSNDFHPQAGSPAIDAGSYEGYAFNGLAPDLGALETAPGVPVVSKTAIGDLKSLAIGTAISLTSAKAVTVTSTTFTDGNYYIEEPSRAAGIKVVPRIGMGTVTNGDMITLTGTVGVDSNGEKCINATAVTSQISGADINALGMSNKALALDKGLDATGLLVRIFGTVRHRASDGGYVYVDDGSKLHDGTGQEGVRVLLNGVADPISTDLVPGQFVTVTGIAGFAKDGAMTVRAVRPRGDFDLPPVITSGNEWAMANWWIDSNLGPNSSSRPFSFTYGGQPSASILTGWSQSFSVRQIDSNRTERTITYSDPAGRLRVRCVATVYSDYPAVEWTLFFDNIGSSNTSIIENVQSLNANMSVGSGSSDATLYYADGSTHVATDFQPREAVLGAGASLRLAPQAGRPSENVLPFFNLAKFSTSGVVIALGWSGQWAATFARTNSSTVNVQAGMELMHLRLYPGESIRTPSTLLLFWNGADRIYGQNQLRRLILDHYTPTPGGVQVNPPMAASPHGIVAFEASTQANMIQGIDNCATHALPIDTWWIDAGWYSCNGNWANVGTWTPDPARYPNGMKPVADEAHAKGYKFLLWFEPERVTSGSWLALNHPSWIYGGSGGGLLNLGNPDALNWVKTNIGGMIGSTGIDIYRNDFNIQPLSYWRNADASDRQGINEIKYVTGLYSFWDYLLATYPTLLIDNCASGGTRLDLELIKRSLALWRSDYGIVEPYSAGQCMTQALSCWLPITGLGANATDPYRWWSYAGSHDVLVFDFYNDPNIWTPCTQMINKLKSVRDMYTGDFYPLTPYTTADNVWEAWQFDRPDIGKGLLEVFRRPSSTTATAIYKLRGLVPSATYILTNLETGWTYVKTGTELTQTGFTVSISSSPGTALITYRQNQ